MRACSYSDTHKALKLAASGMVLDDTDAFATLAKAAAEQDPKKIAQISKEDAVLAKWKQYTTDVTTPQLLVKVMTNQKSVGNVAATLHAIIKKLVGKEKPINESDGEIINMRTATIAAMIKAGVDPSEHFVEPKSDVEMVGACSYSYHESHNDSLLLRSDSTCVNLGNAITQAGEWHQRC